MSNLKIILILISLCVLSGCAARNDDGSIIYNPDGSEKISFWRTTGLVVGLPLIILGAAAYGMKDSGGGGNNSSSYDGNCECPNDKASDGDYCGNRSAYSRAGGANPTREQCLAKESSNYYPAKYTY